jgi:hypothetical protein
MELYAHAVELYATDNQRNFKFAILHLANAVELLLKDSLIDSGKSIYKSPKETISIWAAFELLMQQGIDIPEKPYLEILIDDRNTIQHRFGFPDERATFYYIDMVSKFLQRFLKERYNLEYEEVIPEYLDRKCLPLVGLATEGAKPKIKALYKISPPTAVIEAFKDLEYKLGSIISTKIAPQEGEPIWPIWKRSDWPDIIQGISNAGYLPQDAVSKILTIRMLRNHAAHGLEDDSINWKQAIDYYFDLIEGIERAIKNCYLYKGDTEDSTQVEASP